MTKRFESVGMGGGTTKQSGVPAGVPWSNGRRANGLVLSGVVVAVYVPADGPKAFEDGINDPPVCVFCDVVIYGTSLPAGAFLSSVPVVGTGMHNGHIWQPRAARQTVNGDPITGATDPAMLDGDHVLVQFLEDNLDKPIVTGRLPHPHAGRGNQDFPDVGHRMLLKVADGDPSLWKHNGTFHGVDADGNFVVDTTRAHGGAYDPDDATEQPPNDGTHGDVTFRVNTNQAFKVVGLDDNGENPTFLVQFKDNRLDIGLDDANTYVSVEDGTVTVSINNGDDALVTIAKEAISAQLDSASKSIKLEPTALTAKLGGTSFKVEQSGANAKLTLGSGDMFGMLWDTFDTWATAVLNAMQAHIHNATAPGAPTTPSTNWSAVTAADQAARSLIKSTHLKLPPG